MTLKTLQLCEPYGQLAYREEGQGDPVVLIHGVGMQSAAWGPQIAALSTTHRVLALDMPGHGASDPLETGSGLEDFVEWLHTALKGLGLERVSLAGHSMGALVVGGFAASYPQMTRRVALLNGVFRREPDTRAAVEARAAAIRNGVFDTASPLKRWFGDADSAARAQVAKWLDEVDPAGYATAYSAFAKGDATYADRFGTISCPLLALTGGEDPNSTPAMSRAMAGAAPMGQSVIVTGQRHMVNLTAADNVNSELRKWLQITPTPEDAA